MEILVTGANGQLASCIKEYTKLINDKNNFIFLDKKDLDITNIDDIEAVFINSKIELVINCAAYTNVDDSETNIELAYKINSEGVLNLAICAHNYGINLIHISTDFVFSGQQNFPYKPMDDTLPFSVYGKSKRMGEKLIFNYDNTMIIRTSWLYSNYGKNFFKTILNRVANKEETFVVDDQIGTPTYAMDLAKFIIKIINEDKFTHRIVHYSNNGCCSWYDFAKTIEILYNCNWENNSLIKPCTTENYEKIANKLLAKRPKYSVLDKKETEELIDEPIRHWLEALIECFKKEEKHS